MRRALLGLVAASVALALVALLVPVAVLLRSDAEQRAVSAGTLQAQRVAQQLPILKTDSLDDLENTSVFLPDGSVIGASAKRSESVEAAARGRAFATESGDGVEVLVPTSDAEGTAVVRVYIPESELHTGVNRRLGVVLLISLALFAFALLVADRLARRLTRSVGDLADTARQLAAGDMSARAHTTGPEEIDTAAAEMNELADRIVQLLTIEREEVAGLAHRLRTPLTALRLNAHALRDAEEGARFNESIDDLTREVDELIRTARRPERDDATPSSDLAVIARDRVDFWTAFAEETGRELTSDIPATTVWIAASEDDVAAAIDALIDNIFTHTPEHTAAHVTVTTNCTLTVEDAGGGLASPSNLSTTTTTAAVADRLHALGSTGMGLDLARRTVEAAQGTFIADRSPLGGARITLTFFGDLHQGTAVTPPQHARTQGTDDG